MSTEVRFRRGTEAEHAEFTGAAGEVSMNTTKNALHVHDGATAGGHRTLMVSERGAADGVASLDSTGKVPSSQLPSSSSSDEVLLERGINVADTDIYRAELTSGGVSIGALADTFMAVNKGTAVAPTTDMAPVVGFKKISNFLPEYDVYTTKNVTMAVFADARGSASDAQTQAAYFETNEYGDRTGSGPGFVEGIRSHAVIRSGSANSAAYGAILFAGGESATDWNYLVGAECDVANNTTDAPEPKFFDKEHFTASVLSTAGFGTKKIDAGFITNPWNTSAACCRTGFLVTENSTDHTAFASRASTLVGLDLSIGSQSVAAILIPNSGVIRVKSGDGASDLNTFYVNSSNEIVLGTDCNGVYLNFGGGFIRKLGIGGSDSAGTGFRVVTVAN